MAEMHRKKNLFEKLAPLWAVIAMAGYAGSIIYYYFVSDTFEALDTYDSWLRYLIMAGVILLAFFSFVPEDVTAVIRHTVFYLVAGAAGIGVIYWYANNVFTPEQAESRKLLAVFMSNFNEDDYVSYYLKYSIITTIMLCAVVAAFCGAKLYMSSQGWIKKNIK